jgi:hypothetical protein
MLALLKWQLENKLVTDTTDPAAWYLWPKTREILNPKLKTLLNK